MTTIQTETGTEYEGMCICGHDGEDHAHNRRTGDSYCFGCEKSNEANRYHFFEDEIVEDTSYGGTDTEGRMPR